MELLSLGRASLQLLDLERGIAAANIHNAGNGASFAQRGDFLGAISTLQAAWERGRSADIVDIQEYVSVVEGDGPVQIQGEMQVIGDTALRQQVMTKILGKYIGMMNLVIQEGKR